MMQSWQLAHLPLHSRFFLCGLPETKTTRQQQDSDRREGNTDDLLVQHLMQLKVWRHAGKTDSKSEASLTRERELNVF